MVENIINSIIEAENSAAAEIRAAMNTAKDILFKAEIEKENIKDSMLMEVKTEVKSIISAAEAKANKVSDEIINNGTIEADKLKKSISKGKALAVKMIVGRILSKYGNS